jgi:hypothetical protein
VADTGQDNLLREIDEDLRQERYAKLWKTYGRYVIAATVIFVASVAGFQGWQTYDINLRSEEGRQFAAAQRLAADAKADEALTAFGALSADATAGYALLSRFQEAALLAGKGDRVGAVAAYHAIAADTGIDALYRDLATVLAGLQEAEGTGDVQGALDRLAPIIADDNPWRHSAREVSAVLALRKGDRAKAREFFDALATDPAAPRGIRSRAAEILAVIDG